MCVYRCVSCVPGDIYCTATVSSSAGFNMCVNRLLSVKLCVKLNLKMTAELSCNDVMTAE